MDAATYVATLNTAAKNAAFDTSAGQLAAFAKAVYANVEAETWETIVAQTKRSMLRAEMRRAREELERVTGKKHDAEEEESGNEDNTDETPKKRAKVANGYTWYMKCMSAQLREERSKLEEAAKANNTFPTLPEGEDKNLQTELKKRWNALSEEEKAEWKRKASEEKAEEKEDAVEA